MQYVDAIGDAFRTDRISRESRTKVRSIWRRAGEVEQHHTDAVGRDPVHAIARFEHVVD